MATSSASKRSGANAALKERRALRNAEQEERARANRTSGSVTPWAVRKEARRKRRANDPNIQMQPRTSTGMIICKDGSLKFDTKQARNDALVRASLLHEEEAARRLEKRTASAKAKKARANKHKPGDVTVRKSK